MKSSASQDQQLLWVELEIPFEGYLGLSSGPSRQGQGHERMLKIQKTDMSIGPSLGNYEDIPPPSDSSASEVDVSVVLSPKTHSCGMLRFGKISTQKV